MYKIMLCCSAGMSTSMLVRKMLEAAKGAGFTCKNRCLRCVRI
ncbi:Phosphotransferase system cellobiose-specific component IIB [Kluyvera cryocrescens]|uniref:Phosphotransferase system cellobiose-specific component IIB n=1 Tax=Kluyvera cryocrescens TaxID=580 RepID=A0A485B3X3_KLUCR|nr:Phosphotransferase system cellobiose-specific component IIB [Kluyvera cryocrescens]